MRVRDAIRLVEEHGFIFVRQRGSHRRYKKPGTPYVVTISGNLNDEIHPKTLASILRQAGLK